MTLQTITSSPTSRDVREYISPSRLSLWLKCPLAFALRYVEGIEQPTTPAQLIGTVTHAGLEFFYRHRQMGVQPTFPTIFPPSPIPPPELKRFCHAGVTTASSYREAHPTRR